MSVCLFICVERTDAVHLFFLCGPQRWSVQRHKEPRADIWSGICSRLTADTKYHCVPASFLTVCVMSELQYLIWTTCRKLSPITGLRSAPWNQKQSIQIQVLTDHAVCKSNACDYKCLHVCVWLHGDILCRKVRHQIEHIHTGLTKTFLLQENKSPTTEHVSQNRIEQLQ